MNVTRTLIDTGLPLVPHLSRIREGLFDKGAAIVRADPGSGKSTLLPLSLMENGGKIILLEPRRAAALAVACRMAELLGEKPGERVGYAVRLEREVSARTQIEALTEGLFIRRIQADPSLSGVSVVIFDEFHERSSLADLALAFLLDLRSIGCPIHILIMSATMDGGEIATFINRVEGRRGEREIPVFDIPGRVFPVKSSHWPLPGKTPLGSETGLALTKILQPERPAPSSASGDFHKEGEGDTLVFLPGRREIADAEKTFRLWEGARDFEILPLHGSLPLSQQRQIIAPTQSGERNNTARRKRRIILATNIAESALTIPGITLVVDSGYVRLDRFHIPTAMNRLSLEEASLQSTAQRAGRAGRLGPGHCIKLWEPSSPRPRTTDPEIRRIDLCGLALECLLWGARSFDDLPWLEAPPAAAWERALGLLRELGAVDENHNPTALGKETVKLGLEPRLGILCLSGTKKARSPNLACAAAALLSGRDSSMIHGDGDFRARLALIRNSRSNRKTQSQQPWIQSALETTADLIRRLRLPAATAEHSWSVEEENDIGELLAAAFPDRLAARQESGSFRFVSGREARVEGPLENSNWLIAAEVDAGERSAFIRLAAPVSEETALAILAKQTVSETRVEWTGLVPRTISSRRAGRLFLGEERRVSTRQEAARALPALLREKGLAALPWTEENAAPGQLLERIRFFAAHTSATNNPRHQNETISDNWTDQALIRDAEEWLAPFLNEPKNRSDTPILTAASLVNALKNRFGWDQCPFLDNEVPQVFTMPNGRKRTIKYDSGEPVLSVRLQDCFALSIHPKIVGIPVVFHLLSPADRPTQITSDIIAFWSGSYADVRKEMKGRYPKHFWPENPSSGN